MNRIPNVLTPEMIFEKYTAAERRVKDLAILTNPKWLAYHVKIEEEKIRVATARIGELGRTVAQAQEDTEPAKAKLAYWDSKRKEPQVARLVTELIRLAQAVEQLKAELNTQK